MHDKDRSGDFSLTRLKTALGNFQDDYDLGTRSISANLRMPQIHKIRLTLFLRSVPIHRVQPTKL